MGGTEEDEPFGAHLLGLSTLLVSMGSLIGLRFGGLQGATSGALFGGAAVNAYRAVKFSTEGTVAADREAVVSGTYAVAAAALAGYILWKHPAAKKIGAAHEQEFSVNKARRGGANRGSCETSNPRRSCGFRPIE
jgi:hypothetical protein